MNGPVQMYRAKPIVRRDIAVKLPDCMYKVKSIHASRNNKAAEQSDHVSPKTISDISQQNNQKMNEMDALQERQQLILNQLADLKKQMMSLKEQLKTPSKSISPIKKVAVQQFVCPLEVNQLPDIVINASPSFPPYSLKAVQRLWKDSLHMCFKIHTHSSVSCISDTVKLFSSCLEDFQPSGVVPKINVRLIWKDVGANTELIIPPAVILGEVNILRYLARIGPPLLNYENSHDTFEVDSILDTCYRLNRCKTKTDRSKLLTVFNKSLGKASFLCGRSEIGVADVAAASVIKQVASNEINVNLSKWFARCEAVV